MGRLSQADLLIITGLHVVSPEQKKQHQKHKPPSTVSVLPLCTHQDTRVLSFDVCVMFNTLTAHLKQKVSKIPLKEPRLCCISAESTLVGQHAKTGQLSSPAYKVIPTQIQ